MQESPALARRSPVSVPLEPTNLNAGNVPDQRGDGDGHILPDLELTPDLRVSHGPLSDTFVSAENQLGAASAFIHAVRIAVEHHLLDEIGQDITHFPRLNPLDHTADLLPGNQVKNAHGQLCKGYEDQADEGQHHEEQKCAQQRQRLRRVVRLSTEAEEDADEKAENDNLNGTSDDEKSGGIGRTRV